MAGYEGGKGEGTLRTNDASALVPLKVPVDSLCRLLSYNALAQKTVAECARFTFITTHSQMEASTVTWKDVEVVAEPSVTVIVMTETPDRPLAGSMINARLLSKPPRISPLCGTTDAFELVAVTRKLVAGVPASLTVNGIGPDARFLGMS